jgi:hypothetical protein
MKKSFGIIVPIILGILTIALSPMMIQVFSQEELLVLETGIISTSSKDYPISNNFEIRVFHDGELIRIKGITAEGYPYYAYQKIVGQDIELRGKIFIDGKASPLVKKVTFGSEPKSEVVSEPESVSDTDMMILIKHPSSAYYRGSYNIIAKVFDASANPQERFDQNSGLIEGIDIQIILTDPQGNVFRTFDGITNSMGYVDERFPWQYGDPVGQYNVTVIADDGVNKITRQFETDYKGYHPYYSSDDDSP